MLISPFGVRPSRRNLSALAESVGGAFLLCGIVFALQHRYGFAWADEGLLWYDSQRTSLGGIPIRDYYGYDPGRYYWVSIFFHLLGNNGLYELLIANAAFGAVGLAAVWFGMCASGMRFGWRLTAAVMLAIALGYPRHKVYEQSLSLILTAIVFFALAKPADLKRWLIFGILSGLAAFVGRNSGVYFVGGAVLSGLLLVLTQSPGPHAKPTVIYALGVVLGYSPMLALLVFAPGLWTAFLQSVLFLPHWQLPLPIPFVWRVDIGGLGLIDATQQVAIGIACLFVPIFYVGALVGAAVIKHRTASWSMPMVMTVSACIAGVAFLYQSFDRADFGHIANGFLPAFVAVVSGAVVLLDSWKRRVPATALSIGFAAMMAACWLPYEPAVVFTRARHADPQSVEDVRIDGETFEVFAYQAQTLRTVRQAAERCGVHGSGFLAAPHFPGVYAYLHTKAPFWEMYYLYPRPIEFQTQHVAAIANTRLILLAPDATIDGLERLKLKNTYGILMKDIEARYEPLDVSLPNGFRLYALPGACRPR
ncbi:hypothetical protein [Caballeronia humi]|uniref:Glycosyltransferase RgtA/B/C/D-like domain-containing protein n=1 Tax=Caballeronia humi TaxID=326474 RepID=A0A158IS67_9BURK|nr:hypothetical protein [Caballeronia humi]SAL59019.1 hypothetical protein AWB65_05265 [Caballeronia humi]